ncbi:bifunctional DNA primase/polymerase [Streptomyces pini]|uniref:Bifunctional DNA primase/polymerase, N-terminal n=1 Tax=Streptomyces pini TaxID=1520580 RepID=A0A1I4BZV6_9ACTN|nr:bifunctional DNA primase/polymerase [Streptomyces pini]SFK73441.1 Bifunctional DNA primase/polymerase, N-terminal [Streptomyces pini]
MNTRRCEHCGEHLAARHAHNARFCSGRCRVAAHRARRTIPTELTSRPRWVRRTARKVPLTVGGETASSTDPSTWSRYREAAASTVGTGLGFVLNGDGIVCIDLDHCLDDEGEVLPWAALILDSAPGCWVERSVSGRGLHVWGRGPLRHGRRIARDGTSIEVYGTGRFIAVTGETWGDTPRRLGDLSELIDVLL